MFLSFCLFISFLWELCLIYLFFEMKKDFDCYFEKEFIILQCKFGFRHSSYATENMIDVYIKGATEAVP